MPLITFIGIRHDHTSPWRYLQQAVLMAIFMTDEQGFGLRYTLT
jgi:hypothetical protein